MRTLLPLLWFALVSTALHAQSLTCSIELFRIEGPIVAGPPDLTGLEPYAVQTFTITPKQQQVFKTVVGGATLNSCVTVSPKKEQDEYQAALDLEMIERSEVPPHIETKVATKTQLTLKLNQPFRVGHSSENDRIKAWRVTLTP
jgi:hypothetical protein